MALEFVHRPLDGAPDLFCEVGLFPRFSETGRIEEDADGFPAGESAAFAKTDCPICILEARVAELEAENEDLRGRLCDLAADEVDRARVQLGFDTIAALAAEEE